VEEGACDVRRKERGEEVRKKGAAATGVAPFIVAWRGRQRRGGWAARGSHTTAGRSVGVRRSFRRRRSAGSDPELAGVGGARPECVAGTLSTEIGEAGITDKWAWGHSNGRRQRI
jgi:hypothetical protein